MKRKLCRMLQSKQKGQTFSLPKYITHFIFYNIIVQSFKNRKEKGSILVIFFGTTFLFVFCLALFIVAQILIGY